MSYAKTYYTNFSDFYAEEIINTRISEISEEKQERIKTVKRTETKASLLAGELLIRAALKNAHGLENVKIAVDEYGKPYLPEHPEIHFNLSHSGNIAVCTVSDVECGVDVENASRPHDLMGIAGRFFSTMEQSAVMMSPNPTEAFCRLWTIRESYVKMRGTGFSMGLKALRCDFHRGKASMIENNVPKTDAFFDEFKHIYGYRACICTKAPVEHEVKKVDLV